MLHVIHGVKLYAHIYTWSEALWSMLYKGKVNAHCFTWIEGLCSFLYMNRSFMLSWSDALCPLLCMELTHIE